MTLSDLAEAEREDRLIVPFWNWSSISVAAAETGSNRGRGGGGGGVVLNETGQAHSDLDCSDYFNVP